MVSATGFFPLLIVGGLVGAGMGATAGLIVRRQPERWTGAGRADAGLAMGLVSGVVVLAVFGLVRSDDWGWAPFAAAVGYGAALVGVAATGQFGVRWAPVGVAAGALGILAALALVVGAVLLVVQLIRVIVEGLIDG